jgi:nucleoside-diphosphate-sugar epimerase
MKSLVDNSNPIEYVKGKPSMIPIRRIDSNKIKNVLGWEAKVLPPELAKIMVDADLARLDGAPEGKF